MEKEVISCIYKITSPSGKMYIGQTINFERRMSEYKNLKCKSQKALHRSLIKYGFENHLVDIVFSGIIDSYTLNNLEIEYIKAFNTYKIGLNQTIGGLGSRGYIPTQKQRNDLSARRIGAKASDETKLKMSINRKGKKKPDGFADKCSANKKGVRLTKAHKDNLSIAKKGSIPFNRKPVIDNSTKIIYKSAKELSEKLSMRYSTIRGYISDISNSRFTYLNDTNFNNAATKKVKCKITNLIFNSVKECADINGYRYSSMRAMLNGRVKNKTTFVYA